VGAAANSVAFTAVVYVGTLYLQRRAGYGPIQAGLAVAPLDGVAFVLPLAASGWLARRSPRRLLAAASAVTAAALLWLARAPAPASYAPDPLVPMLALGASLSVAFVTLTNTAIAGVPAADRGVASGIFETANHLFGGAVGAALYATLIPHG
jgi:hypothetical protein